MKASVYTSLFNYSPEKFDLAGAFDNWGKYANEIVIATFPDQKEELKEIIFQSYYGGYYHFSEENTKKPVIKIYSCDTSLEDPLFDGKLKNESLQNCSNEVVIQMDMDERIGGKANEWEYCANILLKQETPVACMIPVIDLYKDYSHYKSVGQKWYLHLKEKTYRGPVDFAIRQDGTLDTESSDSCELIDKYGNLVPYFRNITFLAPLKLGEHFNINACHIIHEGYLDLNKRVENNKFWAKIWTARNGSEVKVAESISELEKENGAKRHNLKEKWWI